MPTWPFGDPTRMFWYPQGRLGIFGGLVGRLEMGWDVLGSHRAVLGTDMAVWKPYWGMLMNLRT